MLRGPGHGLAHGILLAHVQLQRQCLAAGRFDFGGDAEDGAGQFRMRLGALRRDDDIGAVARRAQGDLAADAAAGAGDEQGLALQRHMPTPVPFNKRRLGWTQ
ncbi:hypothetical protein D3C78_1670800 [compost metagenome]